MNSLLSRLFLIVFLVWHPVALGGLVIPFKAKLGSPLTFESVVIVYVPKNIRGLSGKEFGQRVYGYWVSSLITLAWIDALRMQTKIVRNSSGIEVMYRFLIGNSGADRGVVGGSVSKVAHSKTQYLVANTVDGRILNFQFGHTNISTQFFFRTLLSIRNQIASGSPKQLGVFHQAPSEARETRRNYQKARSGNRNNGVMVVLSPMPQNCEQGEERAVKGGIALVLIICAAIAAFLIGANAGAENPVNKKEKK